MEIIDFKRNSPWNEKSNIYKINVKYKRKTFKLCSIHIVIKSYISPIVLRMMYICVINLLMFQYNYVIDRWLLA